MFVAVRMLIAGLILLLVTIASEKRLALPDKSGVGSVFIIGTVQIGLVYALQFPSMIYTSSVHCSILNGSQIITATLFAHLFFKDDHITFKKGLGCLIAFAGVVFCFLYGGDLGSISFRGEGDVLPFLHIVCIEFKSGPQTHKENEPCCMFIQQPTDWRCGASCPGPCFWRKARKWRCKGMVSSYCPFFDIIGLFPSLELPSQVQSGWQDQRMPMHKPNYGGHTVISAFGREGPSNEVCRRFGVDCCRHCRCQRQLWFKREECYPVAKF